MDINKYKLFADVAETQNFTKTGDRMGYTQPGVSHTLKTMEDELGFQLFNRTNSGVYLTPNGKSILPFVRQLLSANEQLEQEISAIKGLHKGHLTIACFASISRIWLPKFIFAFRRNYPGIEIELMEGGTDEIVNWVNENQADFGLLSHRHIHGLKWISLYEDPLMAILPREEPYLSLESMPVEDIIMKKPFILSAEGTDYDIHMLLQKTKHRPDIRFTSKDDHAIVAMVAGHLGVSILPELVIKDVEQFIKAVPVYPYFYRELGIAYKERTALTLAARYFIDSMITEFHTGGGHIPVSDLSGDKKTQTDSGSEEI